MMPIPPPDSFLEQARADSIEFDAGDLDQFALFLGTLLDANQRFNLTAITDPVEAWHKHILDSLSLLPFIETRKGGRIIDLGSGGGLPGIPLAIAMPDMRFTLLEATGKKARFLEAVVAQLELENCAVVHSGAEAAAHEQELHRERYDVVTARALGKLPGLVELALPFARVGGLLLAIKGAKADQEIEASRAALRAVGGEVAALKRTSTGRVVVIRKLNRSLRQYPRRTGAIWVEPWLPFKATR